mmetsp:Transcript_49275/g.107215  ORF Transcript_49275/g.107215 Transcript_49275/m.107215 type:complete len:1143 (-) Transcript_49275:96-3524(-)|eukprot:CAMPEP_0170609682 /NCGR_PEP_ID=MMETSP0224-20130122/22254_1 /TAXON_ID=285029 /ORGANISM="Togula jolla, Strain CCCM 725" /LENGTH=1142 /DNA_ID=CAMNT_0010935003 /DNA_START=66 /DNA_END=3494 /DNA_ORIENTATION=+
MFLTKCAGALLAVILGSALQESLAADLHRPSHRSRRGGHLRTGAKQQRLAPGHFPATNTSSGRRSVRLGRIPVGGHNTSEFLQESQIPGVQNKVKQNIGAQYISTTVVNNLGGLGPEANEDGTLVWAEVALANGVPVDLVVENVSEYIPFSTEGNGQRGEFGIINVASGSSVTLRFTFWNRAARRPEVVDDFVIGVLDLDINAFSGMDQETIIGSGFEYAMVSPGTTLDISQVPDGRYAFAATHKGREDDNPESITDLTPEEVSTSVGLIYYNVSSFLITFLVGEGKRGRNFMFAGKTSLEDKLSPELPSALINTRAAPELVSQIASQGPVHNGPPTEPPPAEVMEAAVGAKTNAALRGLSPEAAKAAAAAASSAAQHGSPEIADEVGKATGDAVMGGLSPTAAGIVGEIAAKAFQGGMPLADAIATALEAADAIKAAGQAAADAAAAVGASPEAIQAARAAAEKEARDEQPRPRSAVAGTTAQQAVTSGLPVESAAFGAAHAGEILGAGGSTEAAIAGGLAAAHAHAEGMSGAAAAASKAAQDAIKAGLGPDAAAAAAALAVENAKAAENGAKSAGDRAAAIALHAGAPMEAAEAARKAAVNAVRSGQSLESAAALGNSAAERALPPCNETGPPPGYAAGESYKCASQGELCYCHGEVTFGHGEIWAAGRGVKSSVQCSSNIFGDPDPYNEKVCMCRMWQKPKKQAWFPVYLVGLTFLGLQAALAIFRDNAKAQPGPMGPEGHSTTDRWHKTIQGTMPAMVLAPMLLAVMLIIAERGEQLGGYPAVNNIELLQSHAGLDIHQQFPSIFRLLPRGTDNFFGADWVKFGLNLLAWVFLANVICRMVAKWKVWPYPDTHHMPRSRQRSVARFWHGLWHFFFSLQLFIVGLLLYAVFVVMNSDGMAMKNVPGASAKNLATKLCIALLTIAYFSVHMALHLWESFFSDYYVSVAMLGRLSRNIDVVPMVCIVFLGAQLVADAMPIEVPRVTALSMYLCTASFMLHLLLATLEPFIFGYRIDFRHLPLEKAAEAEVEVEIGPSLFPYRCCRWASVGLGHLTVLRVAWSLCALGQHLKTPYATLHLMLLCIIAGIYFIVEVVFLALAVSRNKSRARSKSMAGSLFMACCPMLAMLVLVHWCEVSFKLI